MTVFLAVICVAVGAFFGGMLRYGFTRVLPSPVSTFTSNMLGSLAIGLTLGLLALTEAPSEELISAALAAGFAGGLSTWSTMAKELGDMLKAQQYWKFTKYLGFTVAVGIVVAARGGIWAARIVHGY